MWCYKKKYQHTERLVFAATNYVCICVIWGYFRSQISNHVFWSFEGVNVMAAHCALCVCELSDVVCVVADVSVFLMRIENQLRACAYMCHFSFLILSLIPSSMPLLNSCVVSQRLVSSGRINYSISNKEEAWRLTSAQISMDLLRKHFLWFWLKEERGKEKKETVGEILEKLVCSQRTLWNSVTDGFLSVRREKLMACWI